jgi:hypothetical protein
LPPEATVHSIGTAAAPELHPNTTIPTKLTIKTNFRITNPLPNREHSFKNTSRLNSIVLANERTVIINVMRVMREKDVPVGVPASCGDFCGDLFTRVNK